MLAEAALVPDDLGQPRLDRWLTGLGVAAGLHYRRAFRKVAVLMTMARGQQEGRLAAARRATPEAKPEGGTVMNHADEADGSCEAVRQTYRDAELRLAAPDRPGRPRSNGSSRRTTSPTRRSPA